MRTETITAKYEGEEKTAQRTGTQSQAENMQELLNLFPPSELKAKDGSVTKSSSADNLIKFVNEKLYNDKKNELYTAARLEVVGIDVKIRQQYERTNKNRVALGKAPFSEEDGMQRARIALGLED